MIQLTQTAVLSDPADISRLAEEFEETGCVLLPDFLAPPILSHLLDWLNEAQFVEKHEIGHGEVFGTTLFVPNWDRCWFLLHFILNRPRLFEIAGQVAACPKIGNFMGRLHRTVAGADHHIDWHRDAEEARTLGLAINLSTEEYTGGIFQLRDQNRTVRAEVGRAKPGDAFLFRIDREWQHRLTRVQSGRRTVAVGWFRTQPEWREYALNAARSRQVLGANRNALVRTQGASRT
jgi:hypothetical protein